MIIAPILALLTIILQPQQAKSADTQMEILHQSASQGDSTAQYKLATMYYRGNNVDRDLEAAAKLFLRAAEQGQPEAAYMVAVMVHNAEGFVRDENIAINWLKYSAQLGNPNATALLNKMENLNDKGPDTAVEEKGALDRQALATVHRQQSLDN